MLSSTITSDSSTVGIDVSSMACSAAAFEVTLLILRFTFTLDRFDPSDQASMPQQFTGCVQPSRLRLDPQTKQVLVGFFERQLKLLVAHFT